MVAYFFTNDIVISGAMGLGDLIIKTVVYYVHERIWSNIAWGRGYNHGNEGNTSSN